MCEISIFGHISDLGLGRLMSSTKVTKPRKQVIDLWVESMFVWFSMLAPCYSIFISQSHINLKNNKIIKLILKINKEAHIPSWCCSNSKHAISGF